MERTRQEQQAEVRRLGDDIAALRARRNITRDDRERDRIDQLIRLAEHEQHVAWDAAYK